MLLSLVLHSQHGWKFSPFCVSQQRSRRLVYLRVLCSDSISSICCSHELSRRTVCISPWSQCVWSADCWRDQMQSLHPESTRSLMTEPPSSAGELPINSAVHHRPESTLAGSNVSETNTRRNVLSAGSEKKQYHNICRPENPTTDRSEWTLCTHSSSSSSSSSSSISSSGCYIIRFSAFIYTLYYTQCTSHDKNSWPCSDWSLATGHNVMLCMQ